MNKRTTAIAVAVAGAAGIAVAMTRLATKDVADDRARASRTVTVRRDASSLYDFWRTPDRMQAFLTHDLISQLEFANEEPGERIEWRIAQNALYAGLASVTFAPAPGDRGTEVRFTLSISGPAAKAAAALARPFGSSPAQIAAESLRRFKALVETGEIPKAVRA